MRDIRLAAACRDSMMQFMPQSTRLAHSALGDPRSSASLLQGG